MVGKRDTQRKRKTTHAAGLKAMISVSAFAASIIGWALLGKQEIVNAPPADTNFLAGLIHEILGPLPTLVEQIQSELSAGNPAGRVVLRSVSLSDQSSSNSRPSAITRTQSSR